MEATSPQPHRRNSCPAVLPPPPPRLRCASDTLSFKDKIKPQEFEIDSLKGRFNLQQNAIEILKNKIRSQNDELAANQCQLIEKDIEIKRLTLELAAANGKIGCAEENFQMQDQRHEDDRAEWQEKLNTAARLMSACQEAWNICMRFLTETGLGRHYVWWLNRCILSVELRNGLAAWDLRGR